MSNDIEVRARRARALATCLNSFTQPRAKLHFNQHERGTTKVGKAANKA
jgi:hypothetical protein